MALEENIAVLALCETTLDPVAKNEVPPRLISEAQGYKLALKHEQQIAEAFAVLLAHTDDPQAVGAICVEEVCNGTGLLIRTAVNSGHQKERMENFDRIAKTMMRCAPSRDENAVFDDIVAACQLRLLGRLRSSHATRSRRTCKAPIIPKLQDGLMTLNKLDRDLQGLALLRSYAASLSTAFTKLEGLSTTAAQGEPGRHLLKEILSTVELMLETTAITTILDTIPRNIPSWNGVASKNIVESFRKLGQYRSAAQYLIRRARKDPIFRHVTISEVSRQPFAESNRGSQPTSVATGLLSRPAAIQPRKISIQKRLASRLDSSTFGVQECVRKQVQQSKRVHAEIQLLFHYEENEEILLKPRIICSNKHACYLCNLFIKVHGVFYIPSCHGRIYPRWRIPRFDEVHLSKQSEARVLQSLNEFNRVIEDKVLSCLNQPRNKIQDPNESILFIPQAFTPSTTSAVLEAGPSRSEEVKTLIIENPSSLSSETSIPDLVSLGEISISSKDRQSPVNRYDGEGSVSTMTELASLNEAGTAIMHKGSPIETQTRNFTSAHNSLSSLNSHFAPLQVSYNLIRDCPVIIRMSWGSSARFLTPRIHLELSFEHACSLASTASSETSPTGDILAPALQVEWTDACGDMGMPSQRELFDLCLPWTLFSTCHGIPYGDNGLLFKKANDIVSLRALGESLQDRKPNFCS